MAPLSPAAAKRRPTMLDVARLAGGVHPPRSPWCCATRPTSRTPRAAACSPPCARSATARPAARRLQPPPHGRDPAQSEPVIACIADLGSREEAEKGRPHPLHPQGPGRPRKISTAASRSCFSSAGGNSPPSGSTASCTRRGITSVLVLALRASTPDLALTWENFSAGAHREPCAAFPPAERRQRPPPGRAPGLQAIAPARAPPHRPAAPPREQPRRPGPAARGAPA